MRKRNITKRSGLGFLALVALIVAGNMVGGATAQGPTPLNWSIDAALIGSYGGDGTVAGPGQVEVDHANLTTLYRESDGGIATITCQNRGSSTVRIYHINTTQNLLFELQPGESSSFEAGMLGGDLFSYEAGPGAKFLWVVRRTP